MCKWGTTVLLPVTVPARLSHTGADYRAMKPIDSCIAPVVAALNAGGVLTASSCCGHGKSSGRIDLHDGRILVVTSQEDREAHAE